MRAFTQAVPCRDEVSFTGLFEEALREEGAVGRLARAIVTQPERLFSFGRFFSHPKQVEEALKVSQDPAFDLRGMEGFLEKTPSALMVAAGLAQVGNESVRQMMLSLQPDPFRYQDAVNEDPDYLPYLILMAEAGYANISNLLTQLVWGGNELILSSMVGIAAEGSPAAFAALNGGLTAAHLSTLVRFAEQYGDDPVHGVRLLKVLQSPSFNPLFLACTEEDEGEASHLMVRLSHLKNPLGPYPWICPPSLRAAGS